MSSRDNKYSKFRKNALNILDLENRVLFIKKTGFFMDDLYVIFIYMNDVIKKQTAPLAPNH